MGRVQICVAAVLLAVAANARADGEMYPPLAVDEGVPVKTRAQVVAELQQAIRLGLMVEGAHDFPAVSPAQDRMIARAGGQAAGDDQAIARDADDVVVVWGDPRAMRTRIQAEAAEANRLGLLSVGEGDPPIATAEQEKMISDAGRRAVDSLRVAAAWTLP
jgi:hypothetical protein